MTLRRGHSLKGHMTKSSTTSLTRRGHMLMEKYRQLAAEEGHAFKQHVREELHHQQRNDKQQQTNKQQKNRELQLPLLTDQDTLQAEVARSHSIECAPPNTGRSQDDSGNGKGKTSLSSRLKKKGAWQGDKKREVKFVPEAVVLNAAMEGEVELMKECLGKVRVHSQSGK